MTDSYQTWMSWPDVQLHGHQEDRQPNGRCGQCVQLQGTCVGFLVYALGLLEIVSEGI